jgi:hypothetical protein
MSFHSLTLAATPEMKKRRRIGIEAVPIKYPGACPGDLYFVPKTQAISFCSRAGASLGFKRVE